MPVLHLPQLVGLALGLEPKELGLGKPRRQAHRGRRLDDLGRRGRGRRQWRLVKLSKLLRGAPAAPAAGERPRRRRAARPDGPRTIVALCDEPPSTSMPSALDAARARLRRQIAPISDDEQ